MERALSIGSWSAVGGLSLALAVAVAAHAASSPALAPGRWHRRTMMEVPTALMSQPDMAALAGRVFESDLCIGPNRAARGPIAVALADDGSDCRVAGAQVQGDRFSARRECRTGRGKPQVSILAGKFTSTAIAFTSNADVGGRTLTAVSAYAFTGACQASDIAAP